MQAGVAYDAGADHPSTTAKHLRVGVNVSMRDHASLGRLLVRKGLIDEAEYLDVLTEGMNEEVEMYEADLTRRLGRVVTLAPGVMHVGEPVAEKPS